MPIDRTSGTGGRRYPQSAVRGTRIFAVAALLATYDFYAVNGYRLSAEHVDVIKLVDDVVNRRAHHEGPAETLEPGRAR